MGKREKKVIVIVFATVITCIALVIIIPKLIKKYQDDKLLESQILEYDLGTLKELKKTLTDEEKQADYSDDGMTNIEKINKGLSIYSDDTDGDGLRDVDEINIYKSDPLKYSTAGDLYSDYYKVQNNLNVKKKIKEIPKIDIGVDNIELTPKTATDELATYEEYNGMIPSDYNVIVKPFIISGFSGEVKYKLNEEAKNCEIHSYDRLSDKVEKIKSKEKDNDIIFKNDDGKPIFITYKPSYVKKVYSGKINAKLNFVNEEKTTEEEKQYYVVRSYIKNYILGSPIEVYECTNSPKKMFETSDEKFENEVNKALKDYLKDMLSDDEYKIIRNTNILKLNINHSYIGSQMAGIIEKFSEELDNNIIDSDNMKFTDIWNFIKNLFIKVYKVKGTREEMLHEVFGKDIDKYLKFDESNTELSNENDNSNIVVADSGLKMMENSFKFKNMSTGVSPGGVCAGMAYVISNAYNNHKIIDKVDTIPEFNPFNAPYPTYDISDSNQFGCITKDNLIANYNMGEILNSYSNEFPTDDYYNNNINNQNIIDTGKEVEKNDIQLIRVLEYYWIYTNTMIRAPEIGVITEIEQNAGKNRFSEIESLIKYIQDGNVAICGMGRKNGGAHMINIYKVEQDAKDENIYYLRCYDNNYPMDSYIRNTDQGYVKEKIKDVVIKVVRHKMNSKPDTYEYVYDIFNNGKGAFKSKNLDHIAFFTSELELLR